MLSIDAMPSSTSTCHKNSPKKIDNFLDGEHSITPRIQARYRSIDRLKWHNRNFPSQATKNTQASLFLYASDTRLEISWLSSTSYVCCTHIHFAGLKVEAIRKFSAAAHLASAPQIAQSLPSPPYRFICDYFSDIKLLNVLVRGKNRGGENHFTRNPHLARNFLTRCWCWSRWLISPFIAARTVIWCNMCRHTVRMSTIRCGRKA